MPYFNKDIKETLKELKTSEKGLTSEEAKKRLEEYGLNEIKEKENISPLKIFLSQFNSFIVYILIAAIIISLLINEKIDALVISIILVLNAVFGFIQEYKAEKAIEALKKMASLKARVLRDGKEIEIDASELVPGDIILLSVGEKVPADSRLTKSINLQTQEAALTGESLPIKKEIFILPEKTIIADQKNMVFSGTIITSGRGEAVVAKTGMNTEIGKIATLIQEEKEKPTHLQIKLKQLGKWLGIATIIISVIVFVIGSLTGKPAAEMFIAAVALAVAAIPEGLPAVVTISLAMGVQRMIGRHALVRKLPSVETLGATTVICSDKTGTLTKNEMTVKKIFVNDKIIDVSGSGYKIEGVFSYNKQAVNPKEFSILLMTGALCNDAKLDNEKVIGDPTEGALIVSAAKAGLIKDELETKYSRTGEIGFSSERKRMSTFHDINNRKTIFCKGAPDVILELCDRILTNGKIEMLSRSKRKEILKINEEFASQALRVLGFAYKEGNLTEDSLIFIGLQGMIDPAREEVKEAIEKCKKAGIKVVMITGDFIGTAKAIAKEIGIEGKAITGQELEKIKNLEKEVEYIGIYARVDPVHKVKIVDALRARGHVIAMTGDGVNDAPALKKADIGIAMGITGTDVAKEASHMVLTDDNFASIVNAVEEGRRIYDNIKKFVNYLLSCNFGEILVVFIAILLRLPLPLIAIQILWINLITDGLPALALGVDPASPNIMERKPRNPKEGVMTKNTSLNILIIGILMCIASLILFSSYYKADLRKAQTIVFTTLVILEIARVYMIRSQYNVGIFSNKYLILAILSSLAMQLLVIYTPLNSFFKTTPLNIVEWAYIIGAAIGVSVVGMVLVRMLRKLTKETD